MVEGKGFNIPSTLNPNELASPPLNEAAQSGTPRPPASTAPAPSLPRHGGDDTAQKKDPTT
jgi:hypothetical protein